MRVSREHLALLRSAIEPLDTAERRELYRTGKFPRAESVKDLDKRYRWDLFWAARPPREATEDYANAHLDSALRAIVKPLKGEGK